MILPAAIALKSMAAKECVAAFSGQVPLLVLLMLSLLLLSLPKILSRGAVGQSRPLQRLARDLMLAWKISKSSTGAGRTTRGCLITEKKDKMSARCK